MIVQQLNLFDKACSSSQQYRRGDWVVLKRKPKNDGAYLKRGDKVQVEAAHPTNGSVRFWNDRCNEWDYLWPEDIKLCLPPTAEINVESVVETVTGAATAEARHGWLDYHYKTRIDGKQHSIRKPQGKCTGPYYTYRWKEEGKQRAKYVPRKKLNEIYRYIGVLPPNEIVKIIESPSKLESILKK